MATIHANSPRESLSRLEMMMMLSGIALPERAMRQYISSALNMIVQVSRFSDGTRKVVKISEITGMEGDIVLMQDLFEYRDVRHQPDRNRSSGEFRSTGINSIHTEKMLASGYSPRGNRAEAGR